MEIFHRAGLAGGFRIAHVMFAVMWMGLLWFFNFVQTPAYAEMDGAARNNAFDKLTWRALWWFRWAAMATIVSGDSKPRRDARMVSPSSAPLASSSCLLARAGMAFDPLGTAQYRTMTPSPAWTSVSAGPTETSPGDPDGGE